MLKTLSRLAKRISSIARFTSTTQSRTYFLLLDATICYVFRLDEILSSAADDIAPMTIPLPSLELCTKPNLNPMEACVLGSHLLIACFLENTLLQMYSCRLTADILSGDSSRKVKWHDVALGVKLDCIRSVNWMSFGNVVVDEQAFQADARDRRREASRTRSYVRKRSSSRTKKNSVSLQTSTSPAAEAGSDTRSRCAAVIES